MVGLALLLCLSLGASASGSLGWESSVEGFAQAGLDAGTDKVWHGYQHVYGKYLHASRMAQRPFKLLEIGLGCTMAYGPGASVRLWRSWLGSQLELHEMEASAS